MGFFASDVTLTLNTIVCNQFILGKKELINNTHTSLQASIQRLCSTNCGVGGSIPSIPSPETELFLSKTLTTLVLSTWLSPSYVRTDVSTICVNGSTL